MTRAYLNRIAGAVPPHDVHATFLHFADRSSSTTRAVWPCSAGWLAGQGSSTVIPFLNLPMTRKRHSTPPGSMSEESSRPRQSACASLRPMPRSLLPQRLNGLNSTTSEIITHLLISSCTGFSAPGLDLEIIGRCRLPISVERTIVGFMGCCAALNALKLARHIVRSEPKARVLIVNLELCTLHLRETTDLEEILSFLLWGDGCAASLVSAKPTGLALKHFEAPCFRVPRPA